MIFDDDLLNGLWNCNLVEQVYSVIK